MLPLLSTRLLAQSLTCALIEVPSVCRRRLWLWRTMPNTFGRLLFPCLFDPSVCAVDRESAVEMLLASSFLRLGISQDCGHKDL